MGGYEGTIIISDFILTAFIILFMAKLYDKYVISLGMISNEFWKGKIKEVE